MTGAALPFEVPTARSDDDDDVAWALQTAQVQWGRGAYADAVVWLQRACASAKDIGAAERAAQIEEAVQQISARLAEEANRESDPDVVTSAPRWSRLSGESEGESDDIEVTVEEPVVAPRRPPAELAVTLQSQPDGAAVRSADLNGPSAPPRRPKAPPPPPRRSSVNENIAPESADPSPARVAPVNPFLEPVPATVESAFPAPPPAPQGGPERLIAESAVDSLPVDSLIAESAVESLPVDSLIAESAVESLVAESLAEEEGLTAPHEGLGVGQGAAKAPSQAPERLTAEGETSGSLFPEHEPDTGSSAPPPLVLASESELRLMEAEALAPLAEEELAPLSSLDVSDAPEATPTLVEEEEAPVSDSLPVVLLASQPVKAAPPEAPVASPVEVSGPDGTDLRDTSVELGGELLASGTAAAESALKWAGRDASIDELLAEPEPGARFDTDPDGLRPLEPLDVALMEAAPPALSPLEISLEEPSEVPPVSAPVQAQSGVKPLSSEVAQEAAPSEVAQEATQQEAPAQEVLSAPVVGGIDLMEVRGLEDLPEEAQLELAAEASLVELQAEEEVGQFEVALVTAGLVHVMPAIDDLIAASAGVGEVVFTGGSLADGVALRVVAGDEGATVAVWRGGALEHATADCPWVADELKQVADRLQALAGVAMGLLGERLDPALREQVTERMQVRLLLAEEALVEAGAAVPGLMIVGAGRLLVEGGGELLPGEFVLPAQIISREPAPSAVHAGPGGALVLIGEPHLAQELLVSVPPLLELLVS